MSSALLEMRGITKEFPGVKALNNVNISVGHGEVHALCGENGAGKSTLMKVLSGVYPYGQFSGDILFENRPMAFSGIGDSESEGIVIIHQELALVPELSIAENLFLGNEVARGGMIDWPETYRRAMALLDKVGLKESIHEPVGKIGVGKQQLVEIARALSKKVRLLILDEPTASLQEDDSERLLNLILELKSQDVSSILISHKLNEVKRVADHITVLRDGASIQTRDCRAQGVSEDTIIADMVGREMTQRYPLRRASVGKDVLLEVCDWQVGHPENPAREVIRGVSLSLRKGEILGIAGLMGAGRTELALSLFGRSYGRWISGDIRLHGQVVDMSTVSKAIANGVAYVTEDRKELGLILDESILNNTTLSNLSAVAQRGMISAGREYEITEHYRKTLRIRSSSVFQKALNLSGGNQQKVVLSKWLHTEPEVLILDEPTRGIDVGAKYEIYSLINELADQGRGIIVISSEMPELLGMCDRILVMNEGRFVGELERGSATQEAIMSMIINDGKKRAH